MLTDLTVGMLARSTTAVIPDALSPAVMVTLSAVSGHFHVRQRAVFHVRRHPPEAIQAAVEKKTAQQLEDEVTDGLNLALGMERTPEDPNGLGTGAPSARSALPRPREPSPTPSCPTRRRY